jgi:hypothetical protein
MKPTVINRNKHVVSRKQMSPEVLKVLYRLHRTGHLAYLEFVIFCWDGRSTISTLPLMLNPGVSRRCSETAD